MKPFVRPGFMEQYIAGKPLAKPMRSIERSSHSSVGATDNSTAERKVTAGAITVIGEGVFSLETSSEGVDALLGRLPLLGATKRMVLPSTDSVV